MKPSCCLSLAEVVCMRHSAKGLQEIYNWSESLHTAVLVLLLILLLLFYYIRH